MIQTRAQTGRPVSAGIASLVLVTLVLAGCAGSTPAPVEVREAGQWTGQSGGPQQVPASTVAARAPRAQADSTGAASETASGATVIALEPAGSGSSAGPAPSAPPAANAPVAALPRPASPAVVALLDRANEASSAGQHANAASSLERAIKIDPRNPWLWHRLAVTRFDQARAGEAASLAAKSNSLAPANPTLQAANWRLIARVHRARGEDVAARAAEEKARQLDTPRT